MAATFRAAAQAGINGSGTLVINKPTGTVDGDVMVAVIGARGTTSGLSCTPPAGWTLILQQDRATTGRLYTYWKAASSEGASYTFTIAGSTTQHTGGIIAISGANTTAPIDASASDNPGASSSSHVCPSVTTTQADTLVVRAAMMAVAGTTGSYTWASATERFDVTATDGTTACQVTTAATEAFPTAGATGTRTATASTNTSTATASIAIASAATSPVNTVAPAITGTRVEGFALTCSTGTWTNAPTSYTYQWKRDGVNISGETASSHLLVAADVGHTLTCAVVAHNALGDSTASTSNGLAVVAGQTNADIQVLQGGPAGLGGVPGALITDPTGIFDDVFDAEREAGDVEYRLVYIKNAHTVQDWNSAVAWISANTSSPDTTLAIGVATEAAGANVAAIADEQTVPPGVTFGAPATSGAGLSVGNVPAGSFKGLWLRRTVSANAVDTATDTATFNASGTPNPAP